MMCCMPQMDTDLQRLADAVTLRRADLGLSREECARRAGMSNNTWGRIEQGRPARDTSYSRIDRVLDWPIGTCAQILDDPTFEPFPSEIVARARVSQVPIGEDAVRSAIQNATIATAPNLTGAQIMELQERAIAELRRRGLLPLPD